jgi:hypothetical protein
MPRWLQGSDPGAAPVIEELRVKRIEVVDDDGTLP